MKKNFYKIAMLVLVVGLSLTSCKKDNIAPTAKKQNPTNSKTSGDVGSSTPATSYQQTVPPTGCPGHK